MDTIRSEVRTPAFDRYSTTASLAHASEQAHKRNYQDFLIVDVDSHHYENESYKEVFQYIDSPVIRRDALIHIERGGRASMMNTQVGYQDGGGRITRAGFCRAGGPCLDNKSRGRLSGRRRPHHPRRLAAAGEDAARRPSRRPYDQELDG